MSVKEVVASEQEDDDAEESLYSEQSKLRLTDAVEHFKNLLIK